MATRDVWVYADPHFGHHTIIEYAQRPFPNVDKMDGELVKLYNSVVKPHDIVYWLGDVTLKSPDRKGWLRRIIGKMHGTKVLIFGNHDEWHWQHYLDVGFQSCHTFLEIGVPRSTVQPIEPFKMMQSVRLCHDPAWAQDKGYLWVCGHLHNCAFTAPTHIAIVSVELTEYKPVLLHSIVEGLRPGEGVLRTSPRPNREPAAWKKQTCATCEGWTLGTCTDAEADGQWDGCQHWGIPTPPVRTCHNCGCNMDGDRCTEGWKCNVLKPEYKLWKPRPR